MFARLLTALLCTALALPAVASADATIAVRGEYWFMDLSGDVSVDGTNDLGVDLSGSDLSLEDESGLGLDSDNPIGFSAVLNVGSFFLFGRYIPVDISGSGQPTVDVNFGDFTFTGGADLDSSLEFDMYDVGLGFHVLNFDDLPIRIQVGLLAQVKLLDGSVEAKGTVAGMPDPETASEDFTLPIPMAGARVNLGLADFLAVNVQGAAIAYSGNHLYDVEARAEFSPLPFVGISAGYRYLNLTIDESDVNLDATFDGPFIEAFARF
jgi:hypothetical protein